MMDPYRDLNKKETKRRRKRRRHYNLYRIIPAILICLVLLFGVGFLLKFLIVREHKVNTTPEVVRTTDEGDATTDTEAETEPLTGEYGEILAEAQIMAAMYDYEGAIAYIEENAPDYESVAALKSFTDECRENDATLLLWNNGNNNNITHVFFHSLVVDEDVAWASYKSEDYDEVMTTVDEFLEIIQEMYDNGYVLVHLSDIAKIETQADGTEKMVYQPIYLPAGKIPFVLSIDDTAYYEYMINTGCATKLILDENGRVTNEMATYKTDEWGNLITDENGAPIEDTVEVGDFDVVPLLDAFVEEHPDFSYHGAKGTIALTGYNGILGYKTSYIAYGDGDPDWPSAYEYRVPDIEEERAEAAKVADAIKANGWKFASHTWGHMNMSTVVDQSTGTITSERFKRDTQWWADEVETLIGDTDIIIFAFGADIGTWKGYSDTNEAYVYLKSMGFDYFCNVDSSTHYWVQMSSDAGGDGYLRQGRRNLDGTYMYKSLVYMMTHEDSDEEIPETYDMSDLFDVTKVFSKKRPLPVANVSIPDGFDPYSVLELLE